MLVTDLGDSGEVRSREDVEYVNLGVQRLQVCVLTMAPVFLSDNVIILTVQ